MVRRLLLLNGLAIVCLILFHSAGWGFTALFAWSDRYVQWVGPGFHPMGGISYHALRVVEQLVVVAIPAFLFVSGYFVSVAAGRTQPLKWSVVSSRIQALLIPYFIWSALVLVMRASEGHLFSMTDYLKMLATGSANPAFYYVILLGQFYLLGPLLVPLARKHPAKLLIGSALIQLSVQLLQFPILLGLDWPALKPFVDQVPKWLFPARIFWFSFGVVGGFHLEALKAWAKRRRWLWFTSMISTFVVGIFEWEVYVKWSGLPWLNHRETLIDDLYCISVLLCFIAFDQMVVPFSKQVSYLGARSFGIYLAHSPALEVGARTVYHLAPWLLPRQLLLQPLLILVGFAIPITLITLVERSPARRFYAYLLG